MLQGPPRAREALPFSAPQLPLCAPQRSSEESAGLREVFLAIPLASSLAVTSLQLCDGDSSLDTAPRVDAQASGDRTGIGGCAPELDEEGRPDPWRSRWYSHEITKTEWPWVFERSDKPARVISTTIEALAVLMGLKLFYGDEAQGSHTQIQMIPSFTDNRGNRSALNKLMTSKYPSSAVVMELACYLKRMSIKAVVDWAPRTANYEADELANGNTSWFDPAKRITFEESEVRHSSSGCAERP